MELDIMGVQSRKDHDVDSVHIQMKLNIEGLIVNDMKEWYRPGSEQYEMDELVLEVEYGWGRTFGGWNYRSAYGKLHLRSERRALLELLGDKCAECGFGDYRALQIDHVNGGGKQELLLRGRGQNYRYYLAHPEEAKERLQVLCASCNAIKKIANKEFHNPNG